MEALERMVLRRGDWNGTWWGLGWIRPAKHQRIGVGRLLALSFVLSVPGVAVALGLIFLAFRRLDPAFCLALFAGLLLGSTGLRLIQHADSPVMLVGPDAAHTSAARAVSS